MRYLGDALVTFVVLLLVFAAFDDITTDNATAFPAEYTMLTLAAIWLTLVSLRLVRDRHYALGGISLAALGGAVWGQRGIGPGITPGWWPEYVVTTGAYLWFWLLTLILLWQAWTGRTRSTSARLA